MNSIDDVIFGKIAPFLWSKSGDTFNAIGQGINNMANGRGPFDGTVTDQAKRITEEFQNSGKSAQEIQNKLASLPGIGTQFTGQLSLSFDEIAKKLSTTFSGLIIASQVVRDLQAGKLAPKPSATPGVDPKSGASNSSGASGKKVTVTNHWTVNGDIYDHDRFSDKVKGVMQEHYDDHNRRTFDA